MTNRLRIGVAGLGTVGAGVVRLLQEHSDLLARRAGQPLAITAVSARDRNRDRGIDLSSFAWFDDPAELAASGEVDLVVELIGGSDGIAKRVCEKAIANGKPVVTANKALIAIHGTALAKAAEEAGVTIGFEAAVAGGIPIVKALREGLAGNAINRVYGILNGTCNYIMTQMRETGRDFEDVLGEAQTLGYAEADPSFDVDGVDAAHKLAILASVAFGCPVDFDAVHVEGVRHVSATDIAYADELGYRIKLLAIARTTEHGLEQRVHPCMVSLDNPIAHVDGVFNAVVAEGDFVDRTVFEGRGAGAGPTASAVVADILDCASGRRAPTFGTPAAALTSIPASPMAHHQGRYYIRLMVQDRAGVIADVSAVLRDEQISIGSMLQSGRSKQDAVPVILITHEAEEAGMARAMQRIAELEPVMQEPRMIRIEEF